MATSGSFSTGTSGYGGGYPNKLTFSWSLVSQNVSANTSEISWSVIADGGSSGWWQYLYHPNVNVDGEKHSGGTVQAYQGQTIFSGTKTIQHSSDGSRSFSASASGGFYASSNNATGSGSWSLPTIPRASKPSINAPDFNIGDTITIYTNRKSTSFTHTVYLDFGNDHFLVGERVTDSIAFNTSTIANRMYEIIPNANVGQGQIRVITYNGSTQVGTATCTFNAHVTNANPTFSSAYQDTNSTVVAITGNNQNIVRNQSTLQITVNASPKKSASISSSTCKILNTTYNGTKSGNNFTFNIGVVNSASNVTATITVKDSRGNSTTQSLNITVLNWVLPSAIITATRHNNYYSETDINVNADWSSVDGQNTCTIQLRYKKTTDSSYSAYVTMQDNVSQTFTLDNEYAWDVQVLLTDRFGSTTYNLMVNRGMPIQFWDKDKSSVGFNCFPENDHSVEVEKDLLVQGENILARIAGYGQPPIVAPTTDWNTAGGTRSGFYMANNMSNAPGNSTNWFFVLHLAHNAKYMRQLAFDFFSTKIWTRRMDNGAWGSWEQVH